MMTYAFAVMLYVVGLNGAELLPVPASPPGSTSALTEVHFLKLENANLKLQLLNEQAQFANINQTAVMNEVCKQIGFWDCQFNLQNRTVTETPRPAGSTPSAQPSESTGPNSTNQKKKKSKKPKKGTP